MEKLKNNNLGPSKNHKTILIYGVDTLAKETYNLLAQSKSTNYNVLGFIGEDKNETKIEALNIYHLENLTKDFIDKYKIDDIIIAKSHIDSNKLLQLINHFYSINLNVKIVSQVNNHKTSHLIKNITIKDLLEVSPINQSPERLNKVYQNMTILITGAAGSVGRELVKQLIPFKFKQLILIDNVESALYNLQQELFLDHRNDITFIISDIRDNLKLKTVFNTYKPNIVFHAAAYKHVPLMEQNPYEAVKVNVLGTKNLINNAVEFNADKFILISTDKAVNPTSIMGATKRIAEMLLGYQKRNRKTTFITTRFGNLLGSNGSIIPLFKKQIENGGPLTITHKNMSRYFMSIPEACQLIIEASTMGNNHDTFLFNMGKPVKIFDLALSMIKLSELKYPEDINIKIIGLRPGEKIHEELLTDNEDTKPTENKKIIKVVGKFTQINKTYHAIEELCEISPETQDIEIVSKIKSIVPEYNPNNPKFRS
ncbi:polysaccharide biosynthesis protein [Mangrovimonas spongiae]|uniref:Polysaccharide biosynthesis protein n=1 Tax=Mangrovimonas spongiae TaxID=2494697 RepID=A0A428JWZ1_9FLAO|nr:polysaccharide biosynthesis protein [Mangrovimonas spongiae]RSK38707.1 polysaccharide biosynthesis protein [Mangrovimonas spongiae]